MPLVEHATLSVSMFNKLGRKFDNFSSVLVEWKSSDVSLGTLNGDTEYLGQRTENHR